jgi:methylated-DNA-protein-cysteine methyltransferase related protein
MERRSPFTRRVERIVADIPPGVVLAYGEVAGEAGNPRAARAVGRVLRDTDRDLPWWRVVTATGRLVPGLEQRQADLLRAEGLTVEDGFVR